MDIEIYCEKCHALSHEISVEESEDEHSYYLVARPCRLR